jgi:hypothetical protein
MGIGDGDDEDDPARVLDPSIPSSAFTRTWPARTERALALEAFEAHPFEALRGQAVLVRANGFLYRGVLVGADEAELYLRGELRWVVLPLADVTDVRLEPKARVALGGWRPPGDEGAPDAPGAGGLQDGPGEDER